MPFKFSQFQFMRGKVPESAFHDGSFWQWFNCNFGSGIPLEDLRKMFKMFCDHQSYIPINVMESFEDFFREKESNYV